MAKRYDDKSNEELFDFDTDFDSMSDENLDRVLDEIQDIKHTIQGLPDTEFFNDGYDEVPSDRKTQFVTRELNRLGNRISQLQSENDGRNYRQGEDFDDAVEHLISASERQIKRSREVERKLTDEISTIKKQMYKLSSLSDIASAVNALKNDVKSAEEYIINIGSSIDALSTESGAKEANGEIAIELIRQIYDLKNLIGAPSPITARRNDELLDLYNTLARVRYDVKLKSVSIVEKFASVDVLAKKLNETNESDIQPIVDALNAIIEELSDQPLTRATIDTILDATDADFLNISLTARETVKSYVDAVSSLVKDGTVDSMDDLPEIIALKNNIQSNRNEFECENKYSAVLNTNIALLSERDPDKQRTLRTTLKKQINELVSLQVRDLISYAPLTAVKAYRAPKVGEGEGLFDKIGELRSYMLDANVVQSGGVVTEPTNNGLVSEINSLKNEIYSINSMDNVSQAILDLKGDCLTILDKLEEKREEGLDGDIIAGIPTINEIVSQLDRLFDDIKNLIVDSENNVMSSVEVVGEAIRNLTDEMRSAKEDRERLVEDVAFIKSAIQNGEAFENEQSENNLIVASEDGNSQINARLDAIEENQRAILIAIEKLTKDKEESKAQKIDNAEILSEVKKIRDQIFAIGIANISDDETENYESYNELILNEVYGVAGAVEEIKTMLSPTVTNENEVASDEIETPVQTETDEIPKDEVTEEITQTESAEVETPLDDSEPENEPKEESQTELVEE